MFDGSDHCWIPDVPAPRQNELRLRIAQFGDGYQQRTLDGINAKMLRWNLMWANRKLSEVLAMDAYLTAEKGSSFLFLDPLSSVTYRVFCDTWQTDLSVERRRQGMIEKWGTLTAEFYKANGSGV